MTYTVTVLARAQDDFQQMYDWIAERSPDGAARWYSAFHSKLLTLAENPLSCSLAPESDQVDYELRQLFFRTRRGLTYRAVFTVIEDQVRILRVRGPGQRLLGHRELTDS